MTLVYPRLPEATGVTLIASMHGKSSAQLAEMSELHSLRAEWYPTAANRVDEERLRQLQSSVRVLASKHGYPYRAPGTFVSFEGDLGQLLVREMDIVVADAAHPGVWAFMALVLLPDVAHWRFPNPTMRDDYERFLGKPRNVFRRLWWREYVLGSLARELLEDELVGIMERPTIGGSRHVAMTFASVHLETLRANPGIPRTELMRDAIKRVRRLSSVVSLYSLPEGALQALVREAYVGAIDASRPAGRR